MATNCKVTNVVIPVSSLNGKLKLPGFPLRTTTPFYVRPQGKAWERGYQGSTCSSVMISGCFPPPASPPPQPVDRELIHSQIVNRGGRVLDHYSGEKVAKPQILTTTGCNQLLQNTRTSSALDMRTIIIM